MSDEPETPGLALFRACNPHHSYNAYWSMAEESRQVYEARAERFLASDFVAERLREVEAERDDLAAKVDRVHQTARHSYPFVSWPAWTPDQEAAAIVAHAAAHKAVSDDLLRILDDATDESHG